eukprot:CAMPEP_0196574278 /NCGR_PEP_ID=MMETSP1081-20130531/4032_1 /TAXON_ID=36882 /ORGANISM="Pyramimonas amylifera, Strain CCMP720" /LENGTH=217 /DNA_ID=CAMNT_0041892251 /DNA_START=498 /DNA_END=1147 /DNA_ORIENTATION=-
MQKHTNPEESNPVQAAADMRFMVQCYRRQIACSGRTKSGQSKRMLGKGLGLALRLRGLAANFPGAKYIVFSQDPFASIPRALHLVHHTWLKEGISAQSAKHFGAAAYPVYSDILRKLEMLCNGQIPNVPQALVHLASCNEIDTNPVRFIPYMFVFMGYAPEEIVTAIISKMPRFKAIPEAYRPLSAYGLPKDSLIRDLPYQNSASMGNPKCIDDWRA